MHAGSCVLLFVSLLSNCTPSQDNIGHYKLRFLAKSSLLHTCTITHTSKLYQITNTLIALSYIWHTHLILAHYLVTMPTTQSVSPDEVLCGHTVISGKFQILLLHIGRTYGYLEVDYRDRSSCLSVHPTLIPICFQNEA